MSSMLPLPSSKRRRASLDGEPSTRIPAAATELRCSPGRRSQSTGRVVVWENYQPYHHQHQNQQRSRSHQHFLHGLEVGKCDNVLDLPDPPTPTDPLRDVVNNTNRIPTSNGNYNHKHSFPQEVRSASKRRATHHPNLCHEGVSHHPQHYHHPTIVSSSSSSSSSSYGYHAQVHRVEQQLQHQPPQPHRHYQYQQRRRSRMDYRPRVRSTTTRPSPVKRRRLLQTPSSRIRLAAAEAAATTTTATTGNNPDTSDRHPMGQVPPDPHKMSNEVAQIRSLVHAYTAAASSSTGLSHSNDDTEDIRSTIRTQLHETYGYTLTPQLVTGEQQQELADAATTTTAVIMATTAATTPTTVPPVDLVAVNRQKLALWASMGPDLKKLDAHKRAAAADVVRHTGLTVRKVRGSYHYYTAATATPTSATATADSATSATPTADAVEPPKRVSAAQYQASYLAMLRAKPNPWREYFQTMRKLQDSATTSTSTMPTTKDAMEVSSQTQSTADTRSTDTVTVDPQAVVPIQEQQVDKIAVESSQASRSEIVDMSNKVPDVEINTTDLSNPDNGERPKPTTTPSSNNNGHKPHTPLVRTPLLPLPSRDEPSSNPALAAAEERLWTSIDAALERYSQEVVAIQQEQQQLE